MPTYEYECGKGHQFEVEQSISEPALKRCRICRAKARRLISASSFILKGGGWYSDGYGSAKKSSGGDAKGESRSEAKSEPKSETKTESKSSGSDKSGGKASGSAASAP
jgi:putative FmdB family regulatory protein